MRYVQRNPNRNTPANTSRGAAGPARLSRNALRLRAMLNVNTAQSSADATPVLSGDLGGLPGNFAISGRRLLYWASGMAEPQRWDGVYGSTEDAGLPTPSGTPEMSGAGSGEIIGDLYCAVQFIDRLGFVSNISAISEVYHAQSAEIAISSMTNAAPITVTTATAHGLIAGRTVWISGVVGTTSANSSWEVGEIVSTTEFTLVDSWANGDYVTGGVVRTGVESIVYANLPTTTDPKIVGRRILRTKAGTGQLLYVDLSTQDVTSSSLSSANLDEDLGRAVPLTDCNGGDMCAAIHTAPPNWKQVVLPHRGRFFWGVDRVYREGDVTTTSDSVTVTGAGTHWTDAMIGRLIYIQGDTKPREIATVSSATSLTTTFPVGVVGSALRYAIRPAAGEARTIYYSEPSLPESVSPANGFTLDEDFAAGEVTSLISHDGTLYIGCQRAMYRFGYDRDPGLGSAQKVAERGCVSQRCQVCVDGILYLLDESGIHRFSQDQSTGISSVVQGLFSRTLDAAHSLNWSRSDYWHAAYSPEEDVIRWYVCVGGERYPQHAICYHPRREAWWRERYPFPITASCAGRLNGRPVLFLGSSCGRTFLWASSSLDGIASSAITVRHAVTSATLLSATISSPLGESVVGLAVHVAGGRGRGQTRIISSVSSGRLNIDRPWTVVPDSTSTLHVGGVEFAMRTGWFHRPSSSKEVNGAIEILSAPSATAQALSFRLFEDWSTTPVLAASTQSAESNRGVATTNDSAYLEVDTTRTQGWARQSLPETRDFPSEAPRSLQIEVSGVATHQPVRIRQITVAGVRPTSGEGV